jgi:putative DNA primase/helicase
MVQPIEISMLNENRQERDKRAIPIVEYALSYAQNGWYVFPLHGKIPFKDSNGLKDATIDSLQIQTWRSLHPTANIGLATGEKSGTLVLDIDPRNADKEHPNSVQSYRRTLGNNA